MIFAMPDRQALVDELTACLDDETALLDQRLGELEAMSAAIVDRDDDRLEKLLERMERTQHKQGRNDRKLRGIRQSLAAALDRDEKQMKLSVLIEHLPAGQRPALEDRRRKIVALVMRLRKQHLETALLLGECARVNRLLLGMLFADGDEVTMYGCRGTDHWRGRTGLMDAEI